MRVSAVYSLNSSVLDFNVCTVICVIMVQLVDFELEYCFSNVF